MVYTTVAVIVAMLVMLLFVPFKWNVLRSHVSPWLGRNGDVLAALASVMTVLGFPLALLGGYAAYQDILEQIGRAIVDIEFRDFQDPWIVFHNTTSRTAQGIEIDLEIFDLDASAPRESISPPFWERKVDYLRAGASRGGPVANRQMKDAARLFGTVGLECQNCEKQPQYWFFVQKGVEVWYSPISQGTPEVRTILKLVEVSADPVAEINKVIPSEGRTHLK